MKEFYIEDPAFALAQEMPAYEPPQAEKPEPVEMTKDQYVLLGLEQAGLLRQTVKVIPAAA